MLNHNLSSLTEELVAIAFLSVFAFASAVRLFRLALANRLENICFESLLEEEALRFRRCAARILLVGVPRHQALGVFARDERALKSCRLRLSRRHEQHVSVPEQRFRSHRVENRAAVD